MWFILFHIGIDFWIFPNYFIDSNNPLDSFIPFLEVEKRDDMFDFRMTILRIASIAAIVYGGMEWSKAETSIDDIYGVFGDLSNDVFEWGQNKFLGIDNSQALQHKKSAREIFAEAFMEDESMFRTNTQFANFADEEEIKATYEKEQKLKAQEAERDKEPEEIVIGDDDDVEKKEEKANLLDLLTGGDDDDDEEETLDAEVKKPTEPVEEDDEVEEPVPQE